MTAAIAHELARVLAEGVWDGRTHWSVHRAWPADLADASQGHVVELIAPDGRVVGGRLRHGAVELVIDDPALPALASLVAGGWRVLAHRAGKRAVLRRGGGAFRKLATAKATARAAARAETVERLLAGLPDVPPPPARVTVDPGSGILDLAPAAGDSLRSLLVAPATSTARAEAVGSRLGRILVALAVIDPAQHPAGAAELPGHTLADEAGILQRWATSATALAPLGAEESERLSAEAGQIADALHRVEDLPPALAHRDLHDGQVLVDADNRLTLLDWDTAAWTDPCLDTANLLAHLDLLIAAAPSAESRVQAFESGLRRALHRGDHPAGTHSDRLGLLRRSAAVRIRAVHAFRR